MRALGLSLIVLLAAAMAASAQAPYEPAQPEQIEAPFTLIVNRVTHGDVILVLRGTEAFLAREDLAAAGVRFEGGQDELIGERRMLRMSSAAPPLRYELDEENIELRITAPVELLPQTTFDLGGRPRELEYTTNTSAFLNYATRFDDDGNLSAYEETGLSFDGKLLYASNYFSASSAPVRGLTHLLIDDRSTLRRFTLGDGLVRGGPLGSGGFIGGLTLERSFALDPYAVRTPGLGLVGSTATPSTLEVLVNGTRVYTEKIQPGTFVVDNVLVNGGAGEIGYVLRDVFGNEQYVALPYYVTVEALRAGIHEYTYSVGATRRSVGQESWGYHEPAAYAYHRYGLDDHFTLSARAETTRDRLSAGPGLTFISPIGQFDLHLATSYELRYGSGWAAQGAYSYASRRLSFSAYASGISNRYVNVGLAAAEDRDIAELGTNLAVPIGSLLSLSSGFRISRARDRDVVTTTSLQSSVRVSTSLNWSTFGLLLLDQSGADSWQLLTTLSYVFGGGYTAQASAATEESRSSMRLDASKSLTGREGFGYRAQTVYETQSERLRGDASLLYQAPFGRYSARLGGTNDDASASVEAAGAIVVVPGVGIYPTLPVQNGFGIIRVPGVAGVRGYGNHLELGRTDRSGNMVVPNLIPYYANHLSVASEDIPLSYEIESTEVVLAPPPRGVALATFRLTTPHFYRGTLVIQSEQGKRSSPKYGQVTVFHGEEPIPQPLGEHGEFELSELPAGTYGALVEWDRGVCRMQLTLPDARDTVIELGAVVCAQQALAPQP